MTSPTIVEDHQLLIGDAVVKDAPSLMLVVERFPGAKVSDVTRDVEAALDELRPAMPGVEIDTTVYRPASFIDKMVDNLTTTPDPRRDPAAAGARRLPVQLARRAGQPA